MIDSHDIQRLPNIQRLIALQGLNAVINAFPLNHKSWIIYLLECKSDIKIIALGQNFHARSPK